MFFLVIGGALGYIVYVMAIDTTTTVTTTITMRLWKLNRV